MSSVKSQESRLEGLRQCLSQLELLFHIQNLHSVLEKLPAILLLAQYSLKSHQCHDIVADFYLLRRILRIQGASRLAIDAVQAVSEHSSVLQLL